MGDWTPLPVPVLRGVFETLRATVRLYDVSGAESPVYLAWDGHGEDVNPGATVAAGVEGPLRGPFKTLLCVHLRVHCSRTGQLTEFPFKVGHPEALWGDGLRSWVRCALTRIMAHEVGEGLEWPDGVS
jgi:hypothetical protein